MRYKAIRLLSFTLAFMLTSVTVMAQTVSKSPYSRFGTGISTYGGFAQHSALGRTSIGIRDAQSYTPLNPASYSALKYTVFETGTFIEQGTITGDSGASRAASNGSFRYLGVAFPLSEKTGWGASFGLLPYSNIGYNLADNRSDTLVGDYTDIRNGNGGISRFYFGTGLNVFKNLSIGINGYYNFGQLYRSSQLVYVQSSPLFNYVEDRTTTVGGLSYEGGLQYSFGGKDDTTGTQLKHVIGVTYGGGFSMNARRSTVARTFEYLEGRTQQFVIRDTIAYTEDEEGEVVMPGTLGFGYSVSRPGKWLLAAEMRQANWSSYRYYGIDDELTNSQEFSFGGTKFGKLTNADIDLSKFRKLTKNTNYSAGFRFANTNLTFKEGNVQEIGINFGVGIPIRTRIIENDRYRDIYSRLNISAEYFTRGAGLQNKGLVSENYFRVTLGVTLNDKWFNKTKFY